MAKVPASVRPFRRADLANCAIGGADYITRPGAVTLWQQVDAGGEVRTHTVQCWEMQHSIEP